MASRSLLLILLLSVMVPSNTNALTCSRPRGAHPPILIVGESHGATSTSEVHSLLEALSAEGKIWWVRENSYPWDSNLEKGQLGVDSPLERILLAAYDHAFSRPLADFYSNLSLTLFVYGLRNLSFENVVWQNSKNYLRRQNPDYASLIKIVDQATADNSADIAERDLTPEQRNQFHEMMKSLSLRNLQIEIFDQEFVCKFNPYACMLREKLRHESAKMAALLERYDEAPKFLADDVDLNQLDRFMASFAEQDLLTFQEFSQKAFDILVDLIKEKYPNLSYANNLRHFAYYKAYTAKTPMSKLWADIFDAGAFRKTEITIDARNEAMVDNLASAYCTSQASSRPWVVSVGEHHRKGLATLLRRRLDPKVSVQGVFIGHHFLDPTGKAVTGLRDQILGFISSNSGS